MNLTLQLYGQLRQLAGPGAPARAFPDGASLVEVLDAFLSALDPAAREIVFTPERSLRPSLIVLVNDVPVAKDSPAPLRDGDKITLLPAIAGG